MSRAKVPINVIVIGDINSGRSTTIDRLISDGVRTEKARTQQMHPRSAQIDTDPQTRDSSLKMLKDMYERGDPPDFSLCRFETTHNRLTIINTPGHRHFMRNLIQGSSHIDCALLLVSAVAGEFETDFTEYGHTRAQLDLVATLAVDQLIVAVNKMDATEAPFSEQRFNNIKAEISNYIDVIQYYPSTTTFVPISARNGDNFLEVSVNMPWFAFSNTQRRQEQHGSSTLCLAFDALCLRDQLTHKPLRLPLDDVYRIGGIGTVPIGRVATGVLQTNMPIYFAPANLSSTVKFIETSGVFDGARPGDRVGFNVDGISPAQLQRGLVCSQLHNDPAAEVTSFVAYLVVLSHSQQIAEGYTADLCCHTARVPCDVVELISKLHRRSGITIEQSPKSLSAANVAVVRIAPRSAICVERLADYPPLGRFVIRDGQQTIAMGVIKNVEKNAHIAFGQAAQRPRRERR